VEEGGKTAPSDDDGSDVAVDSGDARAAVVAPAAPSRVTRIDAAREREVLDLWARGRRDEAMRVLMSTYGRLIVAYARRTVRDEHDAQDIRQQTFLEVFRGLDTFERRSSLWTWLCKIAFNRCVDAGRRRGRIDKGEVAVDSDVLDAVRDPSEHAMSADVLAMRRALETCLRKLPIAIRLQVLMRTHQGLSYSEIAEIVGDPAGTVQVRIARALPKLQKCLRGEGVHR
jgi:RNA polymerase sigma-70 factor (ECF subfamily)